MNEQKASKPNPDGGHEQTPGVAPDGIWTHLRVSVVATIVLAVIVSGVYPLVVWGLSQAIFHDKANGSLVTDKDGKVIGSKLIGQSFTDAKYFHGRPSATSGNAYDPTASGGSNLGPTSAKFLSGTTKPSTPPATALADATAAAPTTNPASATAPATASAVAESPVTQPATQPTTQPAVVVDNDGVKDRIIHYCDDNKLAGLGYDLTRDDKVIDPKDYKEFQDDKGGWDDVKLILAFNDPKHPVSVKATKPIPTDAVTASASGLDPHVSVENARLQAPRVADARKVSLATVNKLIDQFTDGADLGILGDPGVNVLLLNIELDRVAHAPAAAPAPAPATTPATSPAAK